MTATVRRTDGLLALVPSFFGFVPSESLVVVLIASGRVGVTARLDLDQVGTQEALNALQKAARQVAATGFVLVAYHHGELASKPVLALSEALEQASGARAIEVAHVSETMWRSLVSGEWGRLSEVRAHPLGVAAIAEGRGAVGTREELVERYRPGSVVPSVDFTEAMADGAAAVSDMRYLDVLEETARAVRDLLEEPGEPEPARLGWLAGLAGHEATLPAVLATVSDSTADRWIQLAGAMVRVTSGWRACFPLTILGVSGWAGGNGALTVIASDRIEEIDRHYPWLAMLREVSDECLPPSAWTAMRRSLIDAAADRAVAVG